MTEPRTAIVLLRCCHWFTCHCHNCIFHIYYLVFPCKEVLKILFFCFRAILAAYIFKPILRACLTGHVLNYNIFNFPNIENRSLLSLFIRVYGVISAAPTFPSYCDLSQYSSIFFLLVAFINIIVSVPNAFFPQRNIATYASLEKNSKKHFT